MGRWKKMTAAEWDAVFKAQAGSGISAARFCRDQEINYAQFLYFRKKTGDGCKSHALAMTTAGMASGVAGREGFIPVRVEGGHGMRLRFPRGLVVESDALLPASWVAEVAERWLRMVGEGC